MTETEEKLAVVIQYYEDRLKQLDTLPEGSPNYEEIIRQNANEKQMILNKLEQYKKDQENLVTLQNAEKELQEVQKQIEQAQKTEQEVSPELQNSFANAQANAIRAQEAAAATKGKIDTDYQICAKNLIKLRKDVLDKFKSKTADEQTKERDALAQKFAQSGFDNMLMTDMIVFFDQFAKNNLTVELSADNLRKMTEKLASWPQTDDRAAVSRGKFNPLLRFNRWRQRQSLTQAAKKQNRIENKQSRKLARLNYIFDIDKSNYGTAGWFQYITQAKDRFTAWLQKPERLADASLEDNLTREDEQKLSEKERKKRLKLQKQKRKRETAIDKVATLQSKISHKSVWNPTTWISRANLKIRRSLLMRSERKALRNAPLTDLQTRTRLINDEIARLEQENNHFGDVRTIKKNEYKKVFLMILQAECEKAYVKKNDDYIKAVGAVNDQFEASGSKQRQRVAQLYDRINNKTDILDNSTTTGKWLHAVLEKAPAAQRHELEAMVRTRKQQKFETEDEYRQYVSQQLRHSGYRKTNNVELMEVITQALVKENPEIFGTSPREPENNAGSSGAEDENGNVHEGHSTQPPAPTREWHGSSEDALKESYNDNAYELIAPRREGPNADNENVLYQTFKSRDDDHLVTVEKTDANNYNLTAKDKDGKDSIPTVDDMKAAMEAMKKEGYTTMELGEIKTPEFLARAVMAAEESGIKITNLEEVKERMAQTIGKDNLEQRISADHKRETGQREKEAIKRSGFARDLKVKEGTKVEKTFRGLNALAAVSDMSDEEYRKYKESDEFKSQKLTKNQVKILDGIKKLQKEEKEGRISSKDKRYIRTMSKMIEDYKTIETRYSDKGKKEVAQKAFARGVVQRAAMQKRDNGR